MKLALVSCTPEVETLVATALLTTTSGAKPSALFHRLREDPMRVREIVGRVETQHGSIFEHNRLNWVLEATEGEVLEILLDSRFFNVLRLEDGKWLLSANLRMVVEYIGKKSDAFAGALAKALREVAPTLCSCIEVGRL